MVVFLWFLSCSPTEILVESLECGPGTHSVDGSCVPDEETAGSTVPTTSTSVEETATRTTKTDTGTVTIIEDTTVDVYLLAGQSNTSGLGQIWSLPPSLRTGQADVQIYWSGQPWFRPLEASSEYSSGAGLYFGPEVTFGRYLADAAPDRDVFVIKHSVGGTDLMNFWNPGGNGRPAGAGWMVFMDTVAGGLADLESQGLTPVIKGMGWMQGESDATVQSYATQYAVNLAYFIDSVRDSVGVSDLGFSLGLIHCPSYTPYRQLVRDAQVAVADADATVFVFETEDLGVYPGDDCHYQGTGIRLMGTRMAQSLLSEPVIEFPTAAITVTGSYSGEYYGNFTVGYSFLVNHPILVTDLGRFDADGNGVELGADVGLWDANTQTLLHTEWVPGYLTGDTSIHGGFRYSAVDPFILEPGEYVIGHQTYLSTQLDYIYYVPISVAPSLSFGEGRADNGSGLYYPNDIIIASDTNSASFIGPNMLFQPVTTTVQAR